MQSITATPTIDPALCTGCNLCVAACPSMTLAMVEGKARVVHDSWCIGCGHCGATCPVEAVKPPLPLPDDTPRVGTGPAIHPATMDLLLRERRSVRLYRNDPVPRDVLEQLVEAIRYSPTGTNSQNVEVVVIHTPEAMEELRERLLAFYGKVFALVGNPVGRAGISLVAGRRTAAFLRDYMPLVREAASRIQQGEDRLLFNAPAFMAVHAPADDASSSFNGSVALFSAALLAHSRGLGTCFNGFAEGAINRSSSIRRWLEIPSGHRCQAAMTVGWPAVRYRRLVERRRPPVRWM